MFNKRYLKLRPAIGRPGLTLSGAERKFTWTEWGWRVICEPVPEVVELNHIQRVDLVKSWWWLERRTVTGTPFSDCTRKSTHTSILHHMTYTSVKKVSWDGLVNETYSELRMNHKNNWQWKDGVGSSGRQSNYESSSDISTNAFFLLYSLEDSHSK